MIERSNKVNEITEWLTYFALKWSRLSEQIFRVDKWSLCRG